MFAKSLLLWVLLVAGHSAKQCWGEPTSSIAENVVVTESYNYPSIYVTSYTTDTYTITPCEEAGVPATSSIDCSLYLATSDVFVIFANKTVTSTFTDEAAYSSFSLSVQNEDPSKTKGYALNGSSITALDTVEGIPVPSVYPSGGDIIDELNITMTYKGPKSKYIACPTISIQYLFPDGYTALPPGKHLNDKNWKPFINGSSCASSRITKGVITRTPVVLVLQTPEPETSTTSTAEVASTAEPLPTQTTSSTEPVFSTTSSTSNEEVKSTSSSLSSSSPPSTTTSSTISSTSSTTFSPSSLSTTSSEPTTTTSSFLILSTSQSSSSISTSQPSFFTSPTAPSVTTKPSSSSLTSPSTVSSNTSSTTTTEEPSPSSTAEWGEVFDDALKFAVAVFSSEAPNPPPEIGEVPYPKYKVDRNQDGIIDDWLYELPTDVAYIWIGPEPYIYPVWRDGQWVDPFSNMSMPWIPDEYILWINPPWDTPSGTTTSDGTPIPLPKSRRPVQTSVGVTTRETTIGGIPTRVISSFTTLATPPPITPPPAQPTISISSSTTFFDITTIGSTVEATVIDGTSTLVTRRFTTTSVVPGETFALSSTVKTVTGIVNGTSFSTEVTAVTGSPITAPGQATVDTFTTVVEGESATYTQVVKGSTTYFIDASGTRTASPAQATGAFTVASSTGFATLTTARQGTGGGGGGSPTATAGTDGTGDGGAPPSATGGTNSGTGGGETNNGGDENGCMRVAFSRSILVAIFMGVLGVIFLAL
ncbi:hypothetical protein ABW19_dt0209896 [Dactylella cylindrospora]|nr:hypothetical protein ABW19_dt0209896 [Dactylella cylindrospora]